MYKNMYLSYVLSTLANCVKSDPIYGQHTWNPQNKSWAHFSLPEQFQ